MKRAAFLFLIIFCAFIGYSQTPGVKWTKYVRTNNDGEGFYDIKPTSDKGFIAVGSDSIFGFNYPQIINKRLGTEPWIVKLDSGGNTLWQRTPGFYESGLTSVVQSSDGGFVAAGFDRDPSPPYDISRFHILKY
ncbi:MAG TPA: hypothetical protein VFD56_10635, partial [Chitinophagaceae bacterium]|nr:hypothetical protein [Chitinophagaceae bacterium]